MSQSGEQAGFYNGEENPLDESIAGGPKYKSAKATDVREELIEIRNRLDEYDIDGLEDGLEAYTAVADASERLGLKLDNEQYKQARVPLGELIGKTAALAELAATYEERARLHDNIASKHGLDSSEHSASTYENLNRIVEEKGEEVAGKVLVPAAAEITRETGTSVQEAATDEGGKVLQDWWNTITKE